MYDRIKSLKTSELKENSSLNISVVVKNIKSKKRVHKKKKKIMLN